MKKYTLSFLFLLSFITIIPMCPLSAQATTSNVVVSSNKNVTVLKVGSKGSNVKTVQQILKSAGYLTGSADGVFGQKTKTAVSNFQKKSGLTATGIVDSKTFTSIQGLKNRPVTNTTVPTSNSVPNNNSIKNTDAGCSNGDMYSLTTHQLCHESNTVSIKILSPNGGEVFTAGQSIDVRWSTVNIPSSNQMDINLYVSSTGRHYYLAGTEQNTVNNTGQATFIVPANVPAGQYSIQIYLDRSADNEPNAIDYSDATFTINSNIVTSITSCDSNTAPYVKVLSPNGGETFTAGQMIIVTWTSCNISPDLKVTLELGYVAPGQTVAFGNYANPNLNTGSSLFQIPPSSFFSSAPDSFNYGTYKMGIIVSGSPISDYSDNLFNIIP